MGNIQQQTSRFSKQAFFDAKNEVNFDHFQVLRVIGKGSFGKVCIVQKHDTEIMYAMKYMNKKQCIEKEAIKNVIREMFLLRHLDHPYIVKLHYSFQDEEDLFVVVDLLLGGDLRYHLQQNVTFSEKSVVLIFCQISSALDYLRSQNIIHRDVKPENIILDGKGNSHLTDFNIATRLSPDEVAVSVSGTKPYIAPEVYRCAVDPKAFYDVRVDWWSLGVCIFELCCGIRPYDIHSNNSPQECLRLFELEIEFPPNVSASLKEAILKLMTVCPHRRYSSLEEIKSLNLMKDVNWESIAKKEVSPLFVPPRGHLNCDPSLELEEMIMEEKPLHKKKKRLMKQRSQTDFHLHSVTSLDTSSFFNEFISFNRETWLAEKERQIKEDTWEQELLAAMEASCSERYTTPAPVISEAEQEMDQFLPPADDKISQHQILPSYRQIRSKSLCARINHPKESPVVNQDCMAKSFPM